MPPKAGKESTTRILKVVSERFESMAVLPERSGLRAISGGDGSRSSLGSQAGVVDICARALHRCCGNSPQSSSVLTPRSAVETALLCQSGQEDRWHVCCAWLGTGLNGNQTQAGGHDECRTEHRRSSRDYGRLVGGCLCPADSESRSIGRATHDRAGTCRAGSPA